MVARTSDSSATSLLLSSTSLDCVASKASRLAFVSRSFSARSVESSPRTAFSWTSASGPGFFMAMSRSATKSPSISSRVRSSAASHCSDAARLRCSASNRRCSSLASSASTSRPAPTPTLPRTVLEVLASRMRARRYLSSFRCVSLRASVSRCKSAAKSASRRMLCSISARILSRSPCSCRSAAAVTACSSASWRIVAASSFSRLLAAASTLVATSCSLRLALSSFSSWDSCDRRLPRRFASSCCVVRSSAS
mmetsp:Transcript_22349/g.55195  ORF Transcript_22349/g.55195 Transcript_22349/m.55195 type:complete len:252 (+) Transcript_22349:240-995(+)